MTYARVRLWLGVSAVGSMVVSTATILILNLPTRLLSTSAEFHPLDLVQLSIVLAVTSLWLVPFDFLGGYWAPRRFGRNTGGVQQWSTTYLSAVGFQLVIYVLSAWLLLATGRLAGWPAVLMVAVGLMWMADQLRTQVLLRRTNRQPNLIERLEEARRTTATWGISLPAMVVIDHVDEGFTGGIAGRLQRPLISMPRLWVERLSIEELAAVLARRALAIESGAFQRGVLVAYVWNCLGLMLCAWMPNAGFTSVAEVVTTVCYFTIWSFLGLLWLPTLSRQAALALDSQLIARSGRPDLVRGTAFQLDRWQDNEPQRAVWVERIFHPIPDADKRGRSTENLGWSAWNSARLTLVCSWGCVGLLSRAVHCNLGRPELWLMLPID